MCGKCTDLFSVVWDGKDCCWHNWNHISAAWELLGGPSLETFTCTICVANTMTRILLNEDLNVDGGSILMFISGPMSYFSTVIVSSL